MNSDLSRSVQMQFMRPGQLEAAGREFPVVYVPFGLIEWHGVHLPLGNDALKAHAILVKCAEEFGGVVYPPVYFHAGFDQEHLVPVLTQLFDRLKRTGYRVIIGVSGHNVKQQIEMIDEALEPVVADGAVAGMGLWEITLSRGPESGTDVCGRLGLLKRLGAVRCAIHLVALANEDLAKHLPHRLLIVHDEDFGSNGPLCFAHPEVPPNGTT